MGQRQRVLTALLSIAAAVVLAIAIDDALDVANAATKMGRAFSAGEEGARAQLVLGGGSAASDDGAVASFAGEQTGEEALPSWFEEELFALDSARSVRVAEAGGVVGFSCAESAEDELSRLREQLSSKGWVESRTGVEGRSVFVKEEGICRWAMVSCVPVGVGTSVVVQCTVGEG